MKSISIAAAALALSATAAFAQDNGLTEQEVRAFFAEVSSDAEAAVQAEDWEGIQNWIARHVTDDAAIALRGSLAITGGMVANFEVAMTGTHLERVTGMMMGSQQQMPMDMVEDYSLSTEVRSVNELPNGQASAQVMFHESGRLSPPEDAEHADLPEMVFDALSACAIRLAPNANGPQIVNVMCESITTM